MMPKWTGKRTLLVYNMGTYETPLHIKKKHIKSGFVSQPPGRRSSNYNSFSLYLISAAAKSELEKTIYKQGHSVIDMKLSCSAVLMLCSSPIKLNF